MPRDRVSALFWLAVAIFAIVKGFALKLGSLTRPGAGFFPFWGGVVLAILALVLLVRAFRDGEHGRPPAFGYPRRPLVVAAAILGYVALLEPLGFVAVTAAFLGVLFRLEGRGWTFSALSALAGTAGSYALFRLWLKTQLPVGPFGF